MLDTFLETLNLWVKQYGQWIGIGFAALLLLVLLWIIRRRRRPRRAAAPAGPGSGAALHHALSGDLAGARRVLEQAVKAGGPGRRDALVGLMAVLNAQGEAALAKQIIDDLLRRTRGARWLIPLKVRLALDAGQVAEAASWARRTPELPTGLAVAALVRAGRWEEALARYEDQVPRKRRAPHVWAALLSGCALEYAQMGQGKGAKRALKRAESLSSESLLPAVAGAVIHSSEPDKDMASARAVRLAPWLSSFDETLFPPEASVEVASTEMEVLEEAQAAFDAGAVERALGLLRSHLDERPRAWQVRRRYDEWLLEHGEPSDWKHELREVLVHLPNELGQVGQPMCGRCGYTTDEPFFICPRCDTLGAVRPAAEGPPSEMPRRDPSSKGARLTDLVGSGPPRSGPKTSQSPS
ncbi:MAG: tetratricopeptide repeat protein [Bradymonadia bacterium]